MGYRLTARQRCQQFYEVPIVRKGVLYRGGATGVKQRTARAVTSFC